MKILAWDTSSKAGCVVAVDWSDGDSLGAGLSQIRLVAEFALNVEATHSERLLWAIHQVLVSARWTLDDVDGFAVGTGPGSFTGLRIGVTTARTLAHTAGKPLAQFSSLAALARPVARYFSAGSEKVLVIAATDACKGELFALWGEAGEAQRCVVRRNGVDCLLWSPEVCEEVLTPDQLLEKLMPRLDGVDSKVGWAVVGEGVGRYPALWDRLPQNQKRIFPFPCANQVEGRVLGAMAYEAFQLQKTWAALEVYPRYLRASDAELKLRARLAAQ